jgi:hypothetical protein
MLLRWSTALIVLSTQSEEIMQVVEECRPVWLDFTTLLFTGGVLTSILQIISDAVGNKRIKEMNKAYQEKIVELTEDAEYCFKREEMYKDEIEKIRAKVEMFDLQNKTNCACILSSEILRTINQILPENKTAIPGLDDKSS